jgi:hypothetical protein
LNVFLAEWAIKFKKPGAPGSGAPGRFLKRPYGKPIFLDFGHLEAPRLAGFHAGLATQAFVLIHDYGFAIFDVKNFDRAGVFTGAIASAFVEINFNLITHGELPP